MISARVFGLLVLCLVFVPRVEAQLLISEFQADNRDTISDEDGSETDWIEIYNPTGAAADLEGWYLTDDPTNLQQWRFPALMLDPDEYLLVFASEKDRRDPGSELHTNFRLDSGGEYLALVRPDGTVSHEYDPYPSQLTDLSYGIGQDVAVNSIVGERADAKILVPSSSALGSTWRGGNEPFSDASWTSGALGAGYVTSVPGFAVTNYFSTGDVGSLAAAEQVLDNEGLQLEIHSENAAFIDYLGTGAGGRYSNNRPFPGTNAGDDDNNFVILALGTITVPAAGNWTFGVNSDDGFGLDIEGGGESFHMEFPDPRGAADTLGTFDLPSAGRYDVRLVMYERGGGSSVEFFAAQGTHASFNGNFELVGDTANGGLEVESEVSGVGSLSGVGGRIETDIEGDMAGVNASCYVRVPFEVANPNSIDSLTLRVAYDDGFIAYLNGVEIARRNAPGAPRYDSQATADRPASQSGSLEDINVSDHIDDLDSGSNILALHGLNDDEDSTDFLIYAELAEISIESNVPNYFDEPTPGQPNSAGFLDIVEDTAFSIDRGFFDAPFDVVISTPTEGARIRYTTDGSEPSASRGELYDGPIRIDETTVLRAIGYKAGFVPTNVDTQTYIFLDDVIRQDYQATLDAGFPNAWGGTSPDYGMDPDVIGQTGPDRYGGKYAATIKNDLRAIPTLSIALPVLDMFGPSGIYTNSGSRGVNWERACSAELILPDGSTGFQENAGIRIQGGAFRSHGLTRKHSLRLLFKGIYGTTKLRYPLFGDDPGVSQRFDTITMRANSNDGWQWGSAGDKPLYVRDSFGRELALDMGIPASHETFVHVYINGIYWGLYNPVERPDHSFSATYFEGEGEKEEWDAYSNGSASNGDTRAWNDMVDMSNAGLASDADYQAIQGNFPDGTNDPSLENYVDVDNLILYMITNLYGGNSDWPHKNYWAGRRRGPESTGWKFYMWDSEWSLDLRSGLNQDRTGVDNGIATPYGAMRANAEFRQLFGDYLHKAFFNGGPLYVDPANPDWDPTHPERNRPAALFVELTEKVDRAVVAESARWGDQHASTPYTRDEHWEAEREDLLQNYFPRRSGIVLNQFRSRGLYPSVDAPTFNQHGGAYDDDFALLVSASVGTTYYTLDGSDPRLPGGELSPSAIEGPTGFGAVYISDTDDCRYLVPQNGNLGLDWIERTFNDNGWDEGPLGVGYEQGSGYEDHIGSDVEAEMADAQTSVYVRIPFEVENANSLILLQLGIKYDDGFIAYLNGRRVASGNAPGDPQWDSNATDQHSDSAAVVHQIFDITGDRDALVNGTNVLALHGLNVGTGSSDMLISAQLSGSAAGEEGDSIALSGTTLVRSRALGGNTWSALNEATFYEAAIDDLRVSEIMYHPSDPLIPGGFSGEDMEFVELQNTSSRTVSLDGVKLEGAVRFDFTEGDIATLAPGGFVVVVRDLEAFASRYDENTIAIAGQYSGNLSNGGEEIVLRSPSGSSIIDFDYSDVWYPETDGGGYSLVLDDVGVPAEELSEGASWRASGSLLGSPGESDVTDGIPRGWQVAGDSNQDGGLDVSDAISLLIRLFVDGGLALPCEGDLSSDGNRAVFDVNLDGSVNLSDSVSLLSYLFQSGAPPAAGTSCRRVERCPDVCVP
ncbi:MAG: lamin tail domain-containing protein [Planctomycetota bacterium]